MSTEPKSSIDWEQQRGHVNQDLLRENAELRAGYARARKALGLASEAMNYMGDKASEADIVEDEDIEKTEKAFELAATVLAETPAASLEAIRAEERIAIEEIAREVSNKYAMNSDAAVAIEELVNAIRARGDGGEVAG